MKDTHQSSSMAHDRAISSITQRVCGILALQAGFQTSSVSALTRLGEIALNHMNEICRLSKNFCENSGRTVPIDKDIELALRYLNVDEDGLVNEIAKLMDPAHQVPTLQVRTSNPPNQPKILHVGDSSATRPGHIPAFLPPFPDPHTYIQTKISCEPDVSYAKHREMCANHQQNIDNLLFSFFTNRYPSLSIYKEDEEEIKKKQKEGQRVRGLILKPFYDPRPYIGALLPPNEFDKLDT